MKGLSLILVAAVGSLILIGGHTVAKAKQLASQVKVKFLQFGTPEIKSNSLQLPIILEVTNPSEIQIPVQNIRINFFTRFQNEFVKIGEAPAMGAVTFSPGPNQVITFPVIYFDKVNDLFNSFSAKKLISNFNNADLAEVRIDLVLTIGFVPITIPVYTRLNLVSLITQLV